MVPGSRASVPPWPCGRWQSPLDSSKASSAVPEGGAAVASSTPPPSKAAIFLVKAPDYDAIIQDKRKVRCRRAGCPAERTLTPASHGRARSRGCRACVRPLPRTS